MKRVSWPLILAAVLLLAWGASDFYHYAVTGQAVLQFYEGAHITGGSGEEKRRHRLVPGPPE